MIVRVLFPFLAALGLAACNPVEVIGETEEKISVFHSDWASGNTSKIWLGTDPELREMVERERFDLMLNDFGERFGTLQSSERESFNINSTNGQTVATIVMRSQFSNGEVLETFVYRENGSAMLLASYEAQSPLLDDYDFSKLQGDGLIYEAAPD